MPRGIMTLAFFGIMLISYIVASIIARAQYPVTQLKDRQGADLNYVHRDTTAGLYCLAFWLIGISILSIIDIVIDPKQFLYWLVNG